MTVRELIERGACAYKFLYRNAKNVPSCNPRIAASKRQSLGHRAVFKLNDLLSFLHFFEKRDNYCTLDLKIRLHTKTLPYDALEPSRNNAIKTFRHCQTLTFVFLNVEKLKILLEHFREFNLQNPE